MKVVIPSTACREKNMIFFPPPPPPEASIGPMIKPFGVRRVQIRSSKSPMLNYMCDEHVVNTRGLKVKKWSKNFIFRVKVNDFLIIFYF